MSDQSSQLFERTRAMCGDPYFQEVVWRHCPHLRDSVVPTDLDLLIHPDDQMLWHSLKHHRDANAAFSQYYNVALQQYGAAQQILRALFADAGAGIRVLDFACGYGRLLRFLTLSLPRENIWAAEIQADALAFVRERFRVDVIPSAPDPAAFRPDRDFQLIWVASLFSHLPGRLFEAWLRRLVGCLAPDGALCFSVHDACLLPTATDLPAEGILFRPFSENADLDASTYGTTHVNEDYVAAAIARACGDDRGYVRIARGLAHEQDLYVVPAAPGRDLSALRGFRHGPWGWVDQRELAPSGELYLRGWAASIDDGPLPAVDITVDGRHHRCPTGQPREDVARVFGDPRLRTAGWEFRHAPVAGAGPLRVTVTAHTESDEMALLYTGDMHRAGPPGQTPAPPREGVANHGLMRRLGRRLRLWRRPGRPR